ncbi:hypothetical protein FPZ12_038275 [Amycolatopsis acidicola]|uniref:Outer membrane channel protein CpnT-like N-terminal domain-containing protein n=1 Tax=Amycolatopsis acidicola TaxID=2596893 RepID=A0A5N0USF1_9PSEU|nr:hypothetical protein [Amycolatopsis acidicola]KAA9151774.1 hypothetical protein FPZ12_038275 [Amycolatopsis acidicola]
MSDDNPLVERDATFHLSDYTPDAKALADGDYGKFAGSYFTGTDDPFTGEDNGWLKGTGLPDDTLSYCKDIEKGDWASAAFDAAAVVLDSIGYVTDPAGSILSALISWAMEHLKPLKLIMDELTGNGDTVAAVAKTWGNISTALGQAADDYASAVTGDVAGSWTGGGADAYRDVSGKLHDALATCALIADAMKALVEIAAELVQTVHDTVRDLIASTLGSLIVDALELPEGPPGWALIAEESIGYIARQCGKGAKLVEMLLKVLTDGFGLVGRLLNTLHEVIKILPKIIEIGKDGGKIVTGS